MGYYFFHGKCNYINSYEIKISCIYIMITLATNVLVLGTINFSFIYQNIFWCTHDIKYIYQTHFMQKS